MSCSVFLLPLAGRGSTACTAPITTIDPTSHHTSTYPYIHTYAHWQAPASGAAGGRGRVDAAGGQGGGLAGTDGVGGKGSCGWIEMLGFGRRWLDPPVTPSSTTHSFINPHAPHSSPTPTHTGATRAGLLPPLPPDRRPGPPTQHGACACAVLVRRETR